MKALKLTVITLTAIFTLGACGGGTSNQSHDAKGFSEIENELKNEFGTDAYYTDILISHDDRLGNIISLTVTTAPESMEMEQWNLAQNSWTQSSDITIEVSEGSKAADFMFQLDDKINLTNVGELVEKSAKQLTDEKNIENPTLYTALIKFPKNGVASDMEYSISLKPEHGGTTFSFYYTLNGELIKMDY